MAEKSKLLNSEAGCKLKEASVARLTISTDIKFGKDCEVCDI